MSVFRRTTVHHWLDGVRVPASTTGAKKVKKKSALWYGRVPGSRKAIPLSKNKVVAEQLLAEKVLGVDDFRQVHGKLGVPPGVRRGLPWQRHVKPLPDQVAHAYD